MRNPALETALDQIVQAFRPEPITCQINGKTFFVERIAAGWTWRNGDGECQEDFGVLPFNTAAEAQASAIRHVRQGRLDALYRRRSDLMKGQPTVNLAASPAAKQAYLEREAEWLAAMHEVDGQIAAVKKVAA